jgi:site-specific DNA-adenine methylase
MKRFNKKGIPVVMSNSKSTLTEEIYGTLKGFRMEEIGVSRSISAKSESRKKASEYIIYNFEP